MKNDIMLRPKSQHETSKKPVNNLTESKFSEVVDEDWPTMTTRRNQFQPCPEFYHSFLSGIELLISL